MKMSEKFLRLAELCELMGDNQDKTDCMEYDDAKFEARQLARELFPPMAKALVWIDYGVGAQSQTFLGFYYDIAPMRENFIAHFGDNGSSSRIGARFDTAEGAKAACEAHHQARFLELLA